jgi:phenylpropionate dioxygenase-like ring-hydroxylating dioxygenase large terminal subunit
MAARSEQITTALSALRVAGQSIVVVRSSSGNVAVLADRGAHRPYPLSTGRFEDDRITSGLDGWVYALDGQCVHVPSQTHVPVDAHVPVYPVIDDGAFIWIWPGDPRLAQRRRPPDLDWLRHDEWTTGGGELDVDANHVLLLENFADATQLPFFAPSFAPPVLTSGPTPPLEVEISETSVRFVRRYPAATLPAWHSDAIGVPRDATFAHLESGALASPAVWTDNWDVENDTTRYSLRFAQAVTPIDERSTRLTWRVSRNFNLADTAATAGLTDAFTNYYSNMAAVCETMQRCLDTDGPGIDVDVNADVAGLHVRRILHSLVNEEIRDTTPKRLRQRRSHALTH